MSGGGAEGGARDTLCFCVRLCGSECLLCFNSLQLQLSITHDQCVVVIQLKLFPYLQKASVQTRFCSLLRHRFNKVKVSVVTVDYQKIISLLHLSGHFEMLINRKTRL